MTDLTDKLFHPGDDPPRGLSPPPPEYIGKRCGRNKIRNGVHVFVTNRVVDRTSELRKKGFEGRRLGPKQMTTDTAVRVTRMVVQDTSTCLFRVYIFHGISLVVILTSTNSPLGKGPSRRFPRAQIQ